MGYLIKWDISRLLEKVAMMSPDYVPVEESESEKEVVDDKEEEPVDPVEATALPKKKATFRRDSTFLTATDAQNFINLKEDIVLVSRFRAHADMINNI